MLAERQQNNNQIIQLKEENKILRELVYIRTPTTADNREWFNFDSSAKSNNLY